MRLSVAMCTYNGERFLREQLESLEAQTRLPDEVVICDDGSTDGTRAILEMFRAQAAFPVRLYFNEPNLGVLKNFEQAIRHCHGEIIALCDQDDVWLPEKLQRMEQAFVASPSAAFVFTDLDIVDEELRPVGYTAWYSLDFDAREQAGFRRGGAFNSLVTRNVVTGAAMAFRASYIHMLLPVPEGSREQLLHDYWFALVLSAIADAVPISDALVRYRRHAGQHTGLLPPQRTEGSMRDSARRRQETPVKIELACLVFDRLSNFRDVPGVAAACTKLKARIEHARDRESQSRLRYHARLPRIILELVRGRYHVSAHPDSSGWRDAGSDLVPYRFKRE
ncbi:MAG: glycosyltransferase family 2 protein [Gemmatimonadota bacterium]